ncbi:MAG: CpsD/CapB family tyrosine-protein kinase [Thiolinea sp.]
MLGTIPHLRRVDESRLAMLTALEPDAPVAEAYRIAATHLRFALPDGMPSTLLVTSVNPAEGKSTSTINLALSKVQMGAKVLLIDADLRRPTVHTKMGLTNQRGLAEYVDGKADIASATQHVPGIRGLYVITAGHLRPDPLRALSSPQMRELLTMAKKHFDIILVDAPPLTGFADTLMLTSLVDATVIVTDQEHIDRKQLMSSLRQLQRVKQNVAGFLVVKAQREVTSARYYDRYRESAPAADSSSLSGGGINLGKSRVGSDG